MKGLLTLCLLLVITFTSFDCKKDSNTVTGSTVDSLANGLVAYYPLDSTAVDASGNGNNGTAYFATPTRNRFGTRSKALSFNGSTSYVAVDTAHAIDLYDNFTISAWVYCQSGRYLAGIVSKYQTPASNGFALRLTRTAPYTGIDFSDVGSSNGLLPINAWCHVVATDSSGHISIYVNDSLVVSNQLPPVPLASNSDALTIGVDYMHQPRYWAGALDDIRLYNRVVSRREISLLYHEGGW